MNSQTGQIGFATQAAKGTYVAPAFFTKYTNDDIGLEGDPIEPGAEIGGGRYTTDVYPGPILVTGGLEFDSRANFAGLALYLVSGNDVNSEVVSGVHQHIITSADTIPWFSAQKKVANTYEVWDYTDMKLNSLTLSCEAGAQLVGSLDVRGITESGSATPATAAYESGEVLMWHSAEIKLEGSTICPKSVSMEFNNNLEDDDYRICPTFGRGLGDLGEKKMDLSVTVEIRPSDSSLYKKAVYGSATSDTPTKSIYSGAFWAKFESVAEITGGHKYFIQLDITKAFFKPFKISPSGDDTIQHGLDMIPAKSGSNPLYTATVQNSVDSYTA